MYVSGLEAWNRLPNLEQYLFRRPTCPGPQPRSHPYKNDISLGRGDSYQRPSLGVCFFSLGPQDFFLFGLSKSLFVPSSPTATVRQPYLSTLTATYILHIRQSQHGHLATHTSRDPTDFDVSSSPSQQQERQSFQDDGCRIFTAPVSRTATAGSSRPHKLCRTTLRTASQATRQPGTPRKTWRPADAWNQATSRQHLPLTRQFRGEQARFQSKAGGLRTRHSASRQKPPPRRFGGSRCAASSTRRNITVAKNPPPPLISAFLRQWECRPHLFLPSFPIRPADAGRRSPASTMPPEAARYPAWSCTLARLLSVQAALWTEPGNPPSDAGASACLKSGLSRHCVNASWLYAVRRVRVS